MAEVKTIIGVFEQKDQADSAVDMLKHEDYQADELSVIMKGAKNVIHEHGDVIPNVAGGTLSGAATGGVLGGVAGLLIGIGAIAIPGLGAVLIGGPIAAALGLTGISAATMSGVLTGAFAGGLVGALVTIGVTEEDAREYERQINAGAILVAVPIKNNNEDKVRDLMELNKATQVRVVSKKVE